MKRNIQLKQFSLSLFIFSLLMTLFTGCDGEKDLKIIDGNLPIKTSTLFMVGDATPNGWSMDNPTPFTQNADDPMLFTWEGTLNMGEMKLCLQSGSWDNPFIRPANNLEAISKSNISGQTFAMWAGDPDNKWKVTDAGKYRLTFDMRNWTMSTEYLGEKEKPAAEPISLERLYAIGSATPGGWAWDQAAELRKESDYIFIYEGELNAGEIKFSGEKSWDGSFIHSPLDGVKINKDGVEDEKFEYYAGGNDNKWKVEVQGKYRLTLDLEHWTIKSEFLGELQKETHIYMIGDATAGGWAWDKAQEFTQDASNKDVFTWEGQLTEGTFKMSEEKDFNAPFYRPSSANVTVDASGVSASDMVFTASPDDQWKVTEAGTYQITIDINNKTIKVVKK